MENGLYLMEIDMIRKAILVVTIICCIYYLILIWIKICMDIDDQYTLKNKYIDKHIDRRIVWYNKNNYFI